MFNKNTINFFLSNKRLINNIKHLSIQNFLLAAIQIFYPPLLILFWGFDNYALWLTCAASINLLCAFQISHSEVIKKELAYSYVNNNKKFILITTNSFFLSVLNSIILTISSAIFIKLFHLPGIFESVINSNDTKILIFILLVCNYLKVIKNFYYPVLTFQGDLKRLTTINSFFELSHRLLILTLAFLDQNIVIITLFYFFCELLQTLIYFYYYKKYNKFILIDFSYFNIKLILKYLNLSLGFSIEQVSNNLRNYFFYFLLGVYSNSLVISLFSTARTIFYYMPIQIGSIVSTASAAEYYQKKIKNKKKNILQDLNKYIFLSIFLLIIFIIFSILAGKQIYKIWINNPLLNISNEIILLLTLEASFFVIRGFLASAMMAFHKIIYVTLPELASIVLSTILCIVLLYYLKNYILIFYVHTIVFGLYTLIIYFFTRNFLIKK
jgi:O-antigen/teichoic acid export membrane protein